MAKRKGSLKIKTRAVGWQKGRLKGRSKDEKLERWKTAGKRKR